MQRFFDYRGKKSEFLNQFIEMNNINLYLFYATQNAETAEEVKNYLQKSALTVWENVDNETLNQAIQADKKLKILVLISDDFLKNVQTMRFALWLGQTESRPQVLPVLLYNKRQKPASTEYEWQPTQIYTVPDTVYYRDYWYQEWIRLRKKLNVCPESEKPDLEADIAVAKKLQPAMNTVLGKFRDNQPLSYLKMQNEDYALFWQRFEFDLDAKNQAATQTENATAENTVTENTTTENTATENSINENSINENSINENSQFLPEEVVEGLEESELETENSPSPPEEVVGLLNEILAENHSAEVSQVLNQILEEIDQVETTPTELANDGFSIDQEIEKMEKALQKVEQFQTQSAHTETDKMAISTPQSIEIQSNLMENINLNPEQTPLLGDTQPQEREFALDLSALPNDFDEKLVYENYQIAELTDLDTLFCLAETESEEGDFVHAKICYERILQIDAQNGRALIWLARLQYRFLNNPKAAEICYRKAILCSDESANLYYEYALLLSELGSYRRAVENLHAALELEPEHALSYIALAKNMAILHQNDLAKMYYLQACALDESLKTVELDQAYKVLRKAPILEIQEEPKVNNEFEIKLLADTEEQKTVLVTGATSGIGQAVAEIFALQGFKLIIAGRREEYLLRWQESLEQRFNAKIYPLHIDVSDPQSVENAFLSLPEEFKNVDILINNAGLAKGFGPIHEGNLSHWNQMIDTNLKGILYMINKIAAGMVERRKGHIINVGSAAGKQVYANGAVYCATKAAVDALTSAMRLDLYPHNVRVSAVHPGAVEDTEFSLVRYEDEEKAKIYDKFKPLAAYDVAEMIYYIATRPAYVNVQEVLMFSTQQGSTYAIDKSGRDDK